MQRLLVNKGQGVNVYLVIFFVKFLYCRHNQFPPSLLNHLNFIEDKKLSDKKLNTNFELQKLY